MDYAGLKETKILLPNVSDFTAFSVIACDQFTSEKEYWETLKNKVRQKPSALSLILPEIYLSDNEDKRIKEINECMEEYLKKGYLKELETGLILTVRSTPFVKRRIGLIGAIDLDEYEYAKKSDALIRSTEATIEERIPPRLKIRKDAPIEFPHVMLLFDDEKKEITEYLYENRFNYKKIYDFELNMGGGHIEGYFIDDKKDIEYIKSKFDGLLEEKRLTEKYGKNDRFLFAVGDGNHSLATAKAHWNELKRNGADINHPARYALVEAVNIYDEGIYFEPIYRFVSGVNVEKFIEGLNALTVSGFRIYRDGKKVEKDGDTPLPEIIKEIDGYIREYVEKNGGKVDYIHGESNLFALVDKDKNSVGIMFDKLRKEDLFRYVSEKGAFPKKTFSMGEGVEKRYYLEGRKIK